jgi:hypothetical protein
MMPFVQLLVWQFLKKGHAAGTDYGQPDKMNYIIICAAGNSLKILLSTPLHR